jgi:penicillin-binding protein 2
VSRSHYHHSPYASDQAGSRWPWIVGLLITVAVIAAGVMLVGDDVTALRDRGLGRRPAVVSGATETAAAAVTIVATTPPKPGTTEPVAAGAAPTAAEGRVAANGVGGDTAAAPPPTATATVTPTPEPTAVPAGAVAEAFVTRWSEGNYDGLYDLIGTAAQKEIARDDFVARYQGIADRAGLTSLKATVTGAPNLQTEVPIRVEMVSSIVGSFVETNRIPLVREGNAWKVAWTPSLIFKDLGADGCVDVDSQPAARGRILDRDGGVLAEDGRIVRIVVVPGEIKAGDEPRLLNALSALTGMPEDEVKAKYDGKPAGQWWPIMDFPAAREQELLNAVADLPGAGVREGNARVYPMGAKAAHITGYVSEVTAEQMKANPTLYPGQVVGQAGVEAGADDLLTGTPGGSLIVVQCETRAERATIAERPAVAAKDLVLTIDRGLQEAVDAALTQQGDIRGSAVVLDPRTGAVLAMVSHPTFDPNGFVLGFSAKDQQALNSETRKPLLNRVAQAAYPTGSIFKVITTAAAMQDLGYTGETTIDCPSTFSLEGSNQVWQDWTVAEGLGAQGTLTLHQALVNSCNTVFYQLGRDLDRKDNDLLPKMAKAFGLGAPSNIPYLPEVAGTVPDPKWKLDTFGDYWATGDAVNLAIGQGFLEATPLQMATAYAAIANGGSLLQPYIVDHSVNAKGVREQIGQRVVRNKLPVSRAAIDEIQSALRDQTSDPSGAGSFRVFGDYPWPIAGKTGTAQNGPGQTGSGPTQAQDDRSAKPHSWFAAFGPYGEPATVASIVMIENVGEGVSFAAPVTRAIYDAYLKTGLATSG